MTHGSTPIDLDRHRAAALTISALAMDAVQKANSGHPGMPMGMADLATVLWSRHLVVHPEHPRWSDRDRFVLSNGHGSMLLYALLHLCGFPVTLDDIKSFRQWGSPTAGHPEYEPHLGIEMTTGPLGQGFGTAVGMAIAEAHLNSVFGDDLVDHRTWVFVSDGDLMEGISSETASLAGHLGLGKLNYVYDDNRISIDGPTDITFSEDVVARFEAVGWHTVTVDGHDPEAIDAALSEAAGENERPSLVAARTHIGKGAPGKQDTPSAHGAPLGRDEIAGWRAGVGWPDEDFHIPDGVREYFGAGMDRGREARAAWQQRFEEAAEADPDLRPRWSSYHDPGPVELQGPGFQAGSELATRRAIGAIFDEIGDKVPGLIGGSADLVGSTKTILSAGGSFSRTDRSGRNLHFGVREHAMGTVVNGMALHGGLRPYGATFFVFSDYMRPAMRLSAIMDIPSIWVFTHESVFLGEDGPTHQPIEHLASMRAMPNMAVFRPADAGEMVEAWETVLNQRHPAIILGTRQGVPVLDRAGLEGGVARGGYVLRDGSAAAVIATGSEVSVAMEAADLLSDTYSIRVVSMPCAELFLDQLEEYRRAVLPEGLPVATVEAGATFGWARFAGPDGLTIGIDRFGASAPAGRIAEELGLTGRKVAERLANWLEGA
ncbi:MAG: transketolase [bacterium]|nr:transketolase [bacterium]